MKKENKENTENEEVARKATLVSALSKAYLWQRSMNEAYGSGPGRANRPHPRLHRALEKLARTMEGRADV